MSSTLGLFGPSAGPGARLASPREDVNIVTTTDMDFFEDDLYTSIVNNQATSVQEYLKKGLSKNHVFRSTQSPGRLGKTLLEAAVLENVPDIVKLLVSKGCNVNLMYVVNVVCFTYQLEEYRKPDRLKMTCMYRCIVKGDLDMIRLLVQGGFDVNLFDDRGCTALWHAADLDNYEMLKIMMSAKGCNINAPDNARLRPIHIAAMRGNVKMMSLLIQRGAYVDVPQLRGSTPLVLACRAANYDTVRILLLNGANPNHVGNNGHNVISTALQCTLDRRIPEMILECGALVDLELMEKIQGDRDKFPILDVHQDLLALLRWCSETPRSLKTFCCLQIRLQLVKSHVNMHLIKKVEKLPLPRLIKDYLLFGHV